MSENQQPFKNKIEFNTEIRKLVVWDIIICSIQLLLHVFYVILFYLSN